MLKERQMSGLWEALTACEVRSVRQVADQMGVHPRTVERHCAKTFSRSAKRVLREQRLLRSLASIAREPCAKFSAHLDLGFADHSHFTRECRLLLGETPRALRESGDLRAAMARLALRPAIGDGSGADRPGSPNHPVTAKVGG